MNRIKIAQELLKLARGLVSYEFPTQDAMDKYLKEHPGANRSLHRVVKTQPVQKSQMPSHPNYKPRKMKSIEGISPQEYAAQWGHTKNQGGVHFYNYGSEKEPKDDKFYDEFINGEGGIRHTQREVSNSLNRGEKNYTMGDLNNLIKLEQHVEAERQALKRPKKSSMMIASELVKIAKNLVSFEFPTQEALDKYLKEHPGANKSLHRVVKTQPVQSGKANSIGGVSPGEYAAQWGHTNSQAGAHFYNYSSGKQKKDKKFYDEFIHGKGGIKDTLLRATDGTDKENLKKLLQHVEAERQGTQAEPAAPVPTPTRGGQEYDFDNHVRDLVTKHTKEHNGISHNKLVEILGRFGNKKPDIVKGLKALAKDGYMKQDKSGRWRWNLKGEF